MIAPFVDPWQEDEDSFPPDDLTPILTALLIMLIGAAILMIGLISSMKGKHVERPENQRPPARTSDR